MEKRKCAELLDIILQSAQYEGPSSNTSFTLTVHQKRSTHGCLSSYARFVFLKTKTNRQRFILNNYDADDV